MSTKSREVLFGARIAGARIRAQGARERARLAIREADRAEAEAWSIRMEGYGGPAQPSPTIAQCLNGGLRWLQVKCHRCENRGQHSPGLRSPAARHGDLETRSLAEMPVVPEGALRAAGASDQAHRRAADGALRLGASG